ncbi:MAG: F0F1 ATP synthase subunit epsilon [Oscillatoriales cyanobacterium SM2_2_1]|nr:F0F1 ATP synthase subunit epsilon [Oscillatoriales cyanobacterium SM2_2_1]
MTLAIKVISPDRTVLDDTVEEVILPSTTGQLGILTDHAPLITALDIGVMRYRKDRDWQAIALLGGFAEVEENEVTVLVQSAQAGVDINPEKAREELTAAEQRYSRVAEGDRQGKILADKAVRLARARLQATIAP